LASADREVARPIIRQRAAIARAAALVLIAALAACSRGGDWRSPASSQAAASSAAYGAPPRFTAAGRLGDGEIEIVGRATPNAHIRLASPDGAAYAGTTDSRGAFSIALPAASEVRLFGISEATPGRPIQGEGYLAVLPAPGRAAVLLRAGTGAQAGGPLPPKPMIVAVDFDAAGDTVFSGLARPGQPLRLAVDGMASPEVRADAVGRFSVTLDKPLKAGTHSVVVQSQGAPAAPPVRFSITAAAPVSGLPFRGQRLAAGWRIDWLTPSGGEQTTLIMD